MLRFILAACFLFCICSANAQIHQVYHIIYQDPETGEALSPKPGLDIIWEHSYLTDGFSFTILDGGNDWMYLGDGKNGVLTVVDGYGKIKELSSLDDSNFQVLPLDSNIQVLDYECEGYRLINGNGLITDYFVTNKFKIDPSSYQKLQRGGWHKLLDATEGAVPLKYIRYFENYTQIGETVEISKVKLEQDFFNSSNFIKNYRKDLNDKFRKIVKQHEENFTKLGTDIDNFQTMEFSGHIKYQNFQLPLFAVVDKTRGMFLKMEIGNASYFQISNSDSSWEYDPFENTVVRSYEENRNLDDSPFMGSFNFLSDLKKKETTIRDIRETEINEIPMIRLVYWDEEGWKCIHLFKSDYLVFRSEDEEGLVDLEDYQDIDGVMFPMHISSSADDAFDVRISEVTFDKPTDPSLFVLPDSLRHLVREAVVEKTAEDYYQDAEDYSDSGESELAIENYNQAILLDPKNHLYHNQLGLEKLKEDDTYAAIGEFTKAIELGPQVAIYHSNLGYAIALLGDYKTASEKYSMGIQLDSTDSRILTKRGLSYYHLEDYRKSYHDFKQSIKYDSSSLADYYNAGRVARELNILDSAVLYLSIGIKKGRVDSETYYERGYCYYLMEEYKKSKDDYQTALKKNPESPGLLQDLARTYNKLEEYKKAITALDKAKKIDSVDASIYNLLGIQYADLEDYEQSVFNYSLAIKYNSKEAVYFDNRASAYEGLMKYMEAIEDYDRSLSLYPDDPNIYYRRGMAKINSSNNFDACKDFRKAKELNYEGIDEVMEEYCEFVPDEN